MELRNSKPWLFSADLAPPQEGVLFKDMTLVQLSCWYMCLSFIAVPAPSPRPKVGMVLKRWLMIFLSPWVTSHSVPTFSSTALHWPAAPRSVSLITHMEIYNMTTKRIVIWPPSNLVKTRRQDTKELEETHWRHYGTVLGRGGPSSTCRSSFGPQEVHSPLWTSVSSS